MLLGQLLHLGVGRSHQEAGDLCTSLAQGCVPTTIKLDPKLSGSSWPPQSVAQACTHKVSMLVLELCRCGAEADRQQKDSGYALIG